jgi:EAL domain-containing protein (putative c-di-GMP-specific phosphodiesterase class I)
MQDSDRDLQIMNAMIGMCRQVKTAIVAEMIETQKQAQSLLALGVEFGQGYYSSASPATPSPCCRRCAPARES